MSQFFWGFLFLLEKFPKVGKIDWGALSTVERITINMKDLFALLRKQAWNDAFDKSSSADNSVVFLVHGKNI